MDMQILLMLVSSIFVLKDTSFQLISRYGYRDI